MPLHRLSSVTIGVPDVAATASYYEEFGLEQVAPGRFTSADGGEQLRLEQAPGRRLLDVEIGVDDDDDLARVAHSLGSFGVAVERSAQSVSAVEPVTGVRVTLRVMAHLVQTPSPATPSPASRATTAARSCPSRRPRRRPPRARSPRPATPSGPPRATS